MRPTYFGASWLLFLTFDVAGGAPHKYRVEADGHLAVDINKEARHNASDRGVMRREIDAEAGLGSASLVEQQSTGYLQCGWTAWAPEDPCPSDCPLLAEEVWNPCHFQCVSEDQCGVLDPKATIPDYEQGRCRSCVVPGCDACSAGGKDQCSRCTVGYILDDKGGCYSAFWYVWAFFKNFGVFILVFILLWIVELAWRRPTNLKGLKHGLKFRKRQRNHMPRDTPDKLGVIDPEDSAGLLYPLTTNTLVTQVGGTATSLYFSFQAYVILWAFVLCASWGYWAKTYGYDLVKLGTLPARTPQQLCAVVKWGAKRQQDLMVDKFNFILWAYTFQFVSCIAFTVYQQMKFNKLDDHTTMKDFACYVRGLPYKTGEEDVEGLYKDFLEKETGERLVGVSVAWNMMKKSDHDEVEDALELEQIANEKEHTLLKNGAQEPEEEEDVLQPGGLTNAFQPVDRLVLGVIGPGGKGTKEEPKEINVDKLRSLLEKMKTSDVCFAVFETEDARDAAVEKCKSKKGFMFEKNVVRLETKSCEPATVRWHGISLGSRTGQRNRKLIYGALFVPVALGIWSICFYLPYAYYVSAFTYANGSEPGFVASMVFTMLVVMGNQAMYFIADAVTEWADFAFEDERQMWYNIYYLVACVLNVMADMILTGYMAYKAMLAVGVHTAEGVKLESLSNLQDIVESYPMQKTLGNMLYAYCYPGTFLFPFIFEPLGTIGIPYLAGKWLLRSHREFQGRDAEKTMAFFIPMDLGRYSDLLLNMICAVLVLFLPGGYILPMFLSMALSHIYIYFLDHVRVLRGVPRFVYSRNVNDQFASIWMSVPCALTLSCLVFKGYQLYWPELNGKSLACVMLWAYLGHTFLHMWIIKKIFKMKTQHKKAEITFDAAAKWTPDTWFSVNPVHCLRSKYIWGHEPAQVFYMAGKEHLQRANPKIATYFEDKEAQKPDPPPVPRVSKAEAAGAKAKAAPKAAAGGRASLTPKS